MYRLKDFFLGNSDGKKEAIYVDDFDKYFYNYNGIAEEVAVNKQKFLFLGRKGTGKSILAEFVNKQYSRKAECLSQISSYRGFDFQSLESLKTDEIRPNEYSAIWEWVILLDFAKLIFRDNSIGYDTDKGKLEDFVEKNFSLDLDARKIVQVTKKGRIQGNFFSVGGSKEDETRYAPGSYLSYLPRLREVVYSLMEITRNKYILMYDELDERFRRDSSYLNSITSLVKAVDKVNLAFLKKEINAKAVVFLRTDIFELLNDPDLNKIKVDNSEILNWVTRVDRNCPLFELVLTKVRKSAPNFNDWDHATLFDHLFPGRIYGKTPERYLLDHSFLRPRDIITHLNICAKKYPHFTSFTHRVFSDSQESYSSYFYHELRNELKGHISDVEIDLGFRLLREFGEYEFDIKELYVYARERRIYKVLDLEKMLRVFFHFSIIGNKSMTKRGRVKFTWAYRVNNAILDLNQDLVVHNALRKELGLW